MIPSLNFSLFIKLHDTFDELDNSFLAEDRLILLICQDLLLGIGQIKLRKQWWNMSLFEAQMGQLLLIDACLHPKNSDSRLELPPLQDFIEHLQVSFTVLSLDD